MEKDMVIDIKKYQKVLSEMLEEIDEICKKYHIRYMLFAGSALGAVRHQGFIPWDDDLDIIMSRKDYNKFLEVAAQELDEENYFLQKEFSEHWPMFYSKLRKNNTTCFESFYPKDDLMHQGIFIDIFAYDNLSDNYCFRKIQFLFSKIVIAKSLYKRGYMTSSFKKKLFMQICRIVPIKKILDIVKNEKQSNTKCVHSFLAAGSKYEKNIFERVWLNEINFTQFEGMQLPITSHYDDMLKRIYGNYMEIPNIKDRNCKIHGVFVDLENSYMNYLDMQKKMTFDVYSKSIR